MVIDGSSLWMYTHTLIQTIAWTRTAPPSAKKLWRNRFAWMKDVFFQAPHPKCERAWRNSLRKLPSFGWQRPDGHIPKRLHYQEPIAPWQSARTSPQRLHFELITRTSWNGTSPLEKNVARTMRSSSPWGMLRILESESTLDWSKIAPAAIANCKMMGEHREHQMLRWHWYKSH